jgi:hypothetical protein
MVAWVRLWTLKIKADELNINNETIVESSTKVYGGKTCARISSHTDPAMSRSSGDSHAKTSFGLPETFPVFLNEFFPLLRWKLSSRERGFRLLKALKKWDGRTLSKRFERFNTWIGVGGMSLLWETQALRLHHILKLKLRNGSKPVNINKNCKCLMNAILVEKN